MSISVEHVSKIFGSQQALHDVSFTVNSGEIVGLIGPNGAGKSTLMKIICALLAPTSGEVKLNGARISGDSDDIRRLLGYLPENNPLYTDMYVREFLLFVSGLYNLGKESDDRVREVIRLTGLEPEMHKRIGVLSKGYRQRVGLAQSIIHNPEILILDEPTTGLDPNQILEIRNLISDLGRQKTVILSTHIMQEVEAICQRVIIINQGQIIANDLTGNIGQHSGKKTHTIIVEFSEEINSEILRELTSIDEIRKLKSGTWLIETTGSHDIREELFKLAVKNNLVILSLHKKDRKLEDVFRELTS
ncbi:MAG: gliding motility-associated ABC transporter ATP-binding subunit GldA [Bacteroidales bacterium]|nr:gliding motility-associated ABC transporter ATP-binding subunit GldA [Bacteroidales bacterium]